MKLLFRSLLIACIISMSTMFSFGDETETNKAEDLNTLLMRSTFKIIGSKATGTAFIIGRPIPGQDKKAAYVLVTAAHVLRDIEAEQVILFLRKKNGDEFEKLSWPVQIRKGKEPLWKEHPKGDVAVMYVQLPKEADVLMLSMSMLASDEQLREFEIHPGDVLSCLGYPYGAEANQAGFPILRSGQIASYPLIPASKYPTFLLDFRVFKGNSGGPVYIVESNRIYGGTFIVGQTIRFVMGLVSEEWNYTEKFQGVAETRSTDYPLSLAVIVHASLIREAIELLPTPPEQ